MTIEEAINTARERAKAFRREEISALAQKDVVHAERCRVSAGVLEEFARTLEQRVIEEVIS